MTSLWLLARRALAFAVVLSWTLAAGRAAEVTTLKLGSTTVAMPTPAGFYRIDGINPVIDVKRSAYLPPTNLALASYGSAEDLADVRAGRYPTATRNFSVQVLAVLRERSVSEEEYKQGQRQTREQLKSAKQIVASTVKGLEERAHSAGDANLHLGETATLGVFDEDPNFLAFAMMMKVGANGAQGGGEVTMIFTAGILRVHERLIYLYCTSRYDGPEDLEWARDQMKAWKTAIVAANPA